MAGQSDLFWEAFKKGDKEAFHALYEDYAPILLNYGRRITADVSLIEDSIQDLFIELWQSGEKLSGASSLKFYLFKALRNKIYRNHTVSHSGEMVALDGFMSLGKTLSEEEIIITTEDHLFRIANLKLTLAKLPTRQQEALNLRYYHNFSNEEIAHIMGVNYHSACKLIYAALKYLKDNLRVAVSIVFALLTEIYRL